MTLINLLKTKGWVKPKIQSEDRIRHYSTTGDILAYKRCKRQYGYFYVRGFNSATATQLYFGTLVHDVLDQINRDYKVTPVLPDEPKIRLYVQDAHQRLFRIGIRPLNARFLDDRAIKIIHRFVVLIGPFFFKHVKETEYRLERSLVTPSSTQYILEGIVDILSGAISHDLGLPHSTTADDTEIWDYKSGSIPPKGSRELQSYEYQMFVYSELYKEQTGLWPARAVLVFLGTLDDDRQWDIADGDPTMFPKLFYVVAPHPGHIQTAMDDFHITVDAIESELAMPYNSQWLPPGHVVDKQTCEACEMRYNCPKFKDGAKQLKEPL